MDVGKYSDLDDVSGFSKSVYIHKLVFGDLPRDVQGKMIVGPLQYI